MSYLERLCNRQSRANGAKKTTQSYRTELTELTKPPFVSFVSAPHKDTQLFFKLLTPIESTTSPAPVAPSPAVTEPLTDQTEPLEPGSTQPFGQREIDAIKADPGVWVWSVVLEEWLFWVRDEDRRRKALARGIDAWRVWILLEHRRSRLSGTGPTGHCRHPPPVQRHCAPGVVPTQWRNAINRLEPTVVEEGRV